MAAKKFSLLEILSCLILFFDQTAPALFNTLSCLVFPPLQTGIRAEGIQELLQQMLAPPNVAPPAMKKPKFTFPQADINFAKKVKEINERVSYLLYLF